MDVPLASHYLASDVEKFSGSAIYYESVNSAHHAHTIPLTKGRGKMTMLKADRDQIMENLANDDRKQFQQFIDDYRAKRKAVSGGQMPAREMLDAVGGNLTGILLQAIPFSGATINTNGQAVRTSI